MRIMQHRAELNDRQWIRIGLIGAQIGFYRITSDMNLNGNFFDEINTIDLEIEQILMR